MSRSRVIVIGGGITGLAAAYFLKDRADVTVLEAGSRAGGKIATEDFAGIPVEAGPDAFLARTPDAIDLCRALGLGDELVPPAAGGACLWTRGRLRRLPPGLVLGVPTALLPVARSGILPPLAMARAGLDLVLPASRPTGDRSVGDVISARFGRAPAAGRPAPRRHPRRPVRTAQRRRHRAPTGRCCRRPPQPTARSAPPAETGSAARPGQAGIPHRPFRPHPAGRTPGRGAGRPPAEQPGQQGRAGRRRPGRLGGGR